ncbi:MAG: nucleotidyltransferase domain-containing protein [Thiolinea sp.]
MSSHIQLLNEKQLLPDPPAFLANAVQYEVIMGSVAYGVSNDSSDMDIYAFAIPPKTMMFPHLRGEIPGFDECAVQFEQYQQHHIQYADALGGRGRTYDVTVYAIAKYFRLLTENNPNIIDSLYVPDNCVLYASSIGRMLRERRHLFLHKGCWAKFKGYAYGQMHKIRTKKPEGKRKALVEEFGYDVKFAYHVVRLLGEVEQLLMHQDMDLQRDAGQMKAIRRGEWSLTQLEDYFVRKEADLERVYLNSRLPDKPDTDAIRQLLMDCLEQHFGSMTEVVSRPHAAERTLDDIQQLLLKYQGKAQ